MADIIEGLRAGTHSLRMELERMKEWNGEHPQAALAHLRQFSVQLSACGDLLRVAQAEPADAALQTEIRDYSECLQRIQEALPIMQAQLLAERARLGEDEAHRQATADWAQRSKDTM